MNNSDLVSVIVPVYKVENYLRDCLDSIVNQTYKNLEIILVDDGSPDKSGAICEEYARKDPRITVYHTENKGQAHARNFALDRCRGDYITFIDSDDIARNNYVERLFTLMNDYNADMSAFSAVSFSNLHEGGGGYKIETFCLPPQEIIRGHLYQSQKAPHTGPHCKLFKRKVVENVRFPVGLIYEDLATVYRFISQCERVVFSTEKLYLYRVYFGSTMRQSYKPKMFYSCIQVSQKLYSDIKENFPELEKAAASRAFSVNRAIYFQIPRALKQERLQVWREMKKYRKTVILDPHARKRERLAALLSYSGPEIFHLFAGLYRRWQMRS